MAERRWHTLYFDDWVEAEGLELIHGYKIEDAPEYRAGVKVTPELVEDFLRGRVKIEA